MRWPYFQRALQAGQSGSWMMFLLGVAAALVLPVIAIAIGLVLAQVFLPPEVVAQLPADRLLGPWVRGEIVPWPVVASREVAAVILVGATIGLALLEVLLLMWLVRATQRDAQKRIDALQHSIHEQAFRHGASELLGARRSDPQMLITDKLVLIREGLVASRQSVPFDILAVVGLLAVAMAVNVWLTTLALLMAYVVGRIRSKVVERSLERAARYEDRASQALGIMLETVGLAPLSAGYLIADFPGASFDENLRHYREARVRAATIRAQVALWVGAASVLAVGFLALIAGLSPQTNVVGTGVLSFALAAAFFPARRFWQLGQVLERADDAARHVFRFLDRAPSVSQVPEAKPQDRIRERIAFQHVTLSDRSGNKLLDDLNLELQAGARHALLASDPHTAKAMCGLLVRYYDPAAGRVLFDDQDIGRATIETIRGQALLVDHHAELFTGTVMDNITCGDSGFTMLQISDAARVAGVHDFIQDLPQAYETIVGAHGNRLAPAQSFLIALARAIIRNPSLLIVEEPREQLGDSDGALVDEVMERVGRDRTTIVLPGRINSLRKAERVICIHRGRLDGDGTHAQLLQHNELYRHLNYVRFNSFRDVVTS